MQPMEEDEEARSEKTAALPEQLALPYSPGRTLDPIVCADGMQQVVASLLYEGLFRLNGQMEPEPCLCGSYSKDEESRRYVFELREGVVFSDGACGDVPGPGKAVAAVSEPFIRNHVGERVKGQGGCDAEQSEHSSARAAGRAHYEIRHSEHGGAYGNGTVFI